MIDKQLLVKDGPITEGAILSLEGDLWGASKFFIDNFGENGAALAAGVGGAGFSSGLQLGEIKFRFVNGGDDKWHLRAPQFGLLIRKTQKTILMGVYEGNMGGPAGMAIDRLMKWLVSSGF